MKTPFTKRGIGWVSAGLSTACLAAFGLLVLQGCRVPDSPAAETATIRVKVVRPSRENLRRTTTQPANVEPFEKTEIFAKASGYLQTIHVDIGHRVEKDQVLAELWIPEMEKEMEVRKAAFRQAEAEVKKAQVDVDLRRAEFKRHERLFKDRSIDQSMLDEKKYQHEAAAATVGVADARVDVTKREYERHEELLKYAVIKAPYAGLVTRRFMDTGAFVQSAADGKPAPLFAIVRVDRLRIITDVPEPDSPWIKKDLKAELYVDALRGQSFPGKVVRFADALDPATRTMRTEIELDQTVSALRPGMYGSVVITLAEQANALFLPANTLLISGPGAPGPTVMIVDNGAARRRNIEIGVNDGIRMQITKGLTGDEAVIAEGKNSVQDGQPVEIVN